MSPGLREALAFQFAGSRKSIEKRPGCVWEVTDEPLPACQDRAMGGDAALAEADAKDDIPSQGGWLPSGCRLRPASLRTLFAGCRSAHGRDGAREASLRDNGGAPLRGAVFLRSLRRSEPPDLRVRVEPKGCRPGQRDGCVRIARPKTRADRPQGA